MKHILIFTISILFFSSNHLFASKPEKLKSSISGKDSVVTNTFTISNMTCGGDAAIMQKALYEKSGVKQCVVSAQKSTVFVKYDAKKVSKEELQKLIEDCSLCHDKNTKPFKVTGVQ